MKESIKSIISQINELSIFELQNLIKELEVTFNIDSSNMLSSNSNQKSEEVVAEKVAEQTEFNISLIKVPADKKIAVLKVVRTLTGLGLKESKDIVDNTPKVLKTNISKQEAEQIQKDFVALGAEILIN